MRANCFERAVIFVACLVIVDSYRLCTDCYVEINSEAEFVCRYDKCDAFLWPKDVPLPTNL